MTTPHYDRPGIGEHCVFPFIREKTLRLPAVWWGVCILLSICLYLIVFSVIRKPYSVGIYQDLIKTKVDQIQSAQGRRILIIGGSNVRISHQAKELEKILGVPTINCGLSADLSLQFMLHVYEPLLREGDLLYIPLEYETLISNQEHTRSDFYYLACYDQSIRSRYPLADKISIMFSFDLTDLFAEPVEVFAANKVGNRRSDINKWGDQVGYTLKAAEPYRKMILTGSPLPMPSVENLRSSPTTVKLLESFLARCKKRGVHVVGGLPTTIKDRAIEPEFVNLIASIYKKHGHDFLELPNHSQYPREQFYDSQYHLLESAAKEHTTVLAEHLRNLVNHP